MLFSEDAAYRFHPWAGRRKRAQTNGCQLPEREYVLAGCAGSDERDRNAE